MVMTAVVVVATCCDSVAAATLRGGSFVAAAMLPVTLGTLDQRRLVGADARGGTVGATLQTRKQKD
jgi:hypothetical protein